jgi:DNA-binding transcriptional ArsR family regulator
LIKRIYGYNIFTMMNTVSQTVTVPISALFQTLSVAPRLEILLAIGEAEACVCHLEAALGYRQAFISQHLMALREANILTSRRDGRFIFYSLSDRRVLDILTQAGEFLGQSVTLLPLKLFACECPNCNTET